MSKQAQGPPVPDVSSLKDADYSKTSELEQKFKPFKKVSDPRFGEITIAQNPQTRQFIAIKEKKITDKKETGQSILYARKRVNLKHPHILNLLDYSVIKQSELCSSFYILKFFFEYPKSDLRKEIQERERVGEGFSDLELTHLLYQQIQANSFLQSKDLFNGDIQPIHIGYDRDGPNSKLIEKFEDVAGNLNKNKQLQKNYLISGKPLYQSPTTYSNLKKGNINYTIDPAKEDAFALGLTLLEAGNGHSIQNIYDAKAGNINREALNAHQQEFASRYGGPNSLLPKAVTSLTAYEEVERWGFRELESRLPDYETVKHSLANAQRNGSRPEPIILDKIVREKVESVPAPDLFQSNPQLNEVQPALIADPYSHFAQVHAQPTTEYSFTPSQPSDPNQTYERRVVNLADISGQDNTRVYQNDQSYTLPTNYSYTTYHQPQNTTYVYSQPYSQEYRVEGTPVEYTNQTISYYQPGQTNYVYSQPQETQYVGQVYTQPFEGDFGPIQGRVVRNETVVMRETITPEGSQNQGLNIAGLKLVKTYTDATNATDKPNY